MCSQVDAIFEQNLIELEKLMVVEKKEYSEMVYQNLQSSVLERTFLNMYASKIGKSKTKIFRRFIRHLMEKNPSLVELAKKEIDGDTIG